MELEKWLQDDFRETVEAHIERDPVSIALDKHIPDAALVATQVKYLQRARKKLPTFYAARCILPPRAYEQSSSEVLALHKNLSGHTVIDLTCGLGVDTWALAQKFDRVVSIERDPILTAVARENFRRLGLKNVDVINASAEEFLDTYDENPDWVYIDPDRRDATGKRKVRLEDCAPNVLEIITPNTNFCLKLSPLFDVDEAFRLFPNAHVEVVSLDGECKEILVYVSPEFTTPRLTATALERGSFTTDKHATACHKTFDPGIYNYLFIPDVALQKSRLVFAHLNDSGVDIWNNDGYGFSLEERESLLGKFLPVDRIEPYDPKALKGIRATVLKACFPSKISIPIRPGGTLHLALTTIAGKYWTVFLK